MAAVYQLIMIFFFPHFIYRVKEFGYPGFVEFQVSLYVTVGKNLGGVYTLFIASAVDSNHLLEFKAMVFIICCHGVWFCKFHLILLVSIIIIAHDSDRYLKVIARIMFGWDVACAAHSPVKKRTCVK